MRKILKEIFSLLRLNTGKTNIKVAVLCLLAATLFWFFNSLNKDYTANVRYPISFLYDTDSFQAMDELPEEVLLNMSGVGWNLLRKSLGIQTQPLQIRLDAPDNTRWIPGSALPSAITDQVTDLQLNYVLTDTLYLEIDRKITKTLKVGVRKDRLSFMDNYVLSEDGISIEPDSVELSGPLSIIESLGDTLFLDIPQDEGFDESFEDELDIVLPRQELLITTPSSVSVTIPVEELMVIDRQVPITPRNFPRNVELADTLLNVTVYTRQRHLDEMQVNEFTAIVNFRDLNAEDSTLLPTLIRYPSAAEMVVSDTSRIKVIFR